jgi:hypothetical protein
MINWNENYWVSKPKAYHSSNNMFQQTFNYKDGHKHLLLCGLPNKSPLFYDIVGKCDIYELRRDELPLELLENYKLLRAELTNHFNNTVFYNVNLPCNKQLVYQSKGEGND